MAKVIDAQTGEIVREPSGGFVALDPTAPGGVRDVSGRPQWLATISAGHKVQNDKGTVYPRASQHGEIYVSDPDNRGEGLRRALGAIPDEGFPGCYVSPVEAQLTVALAGDDIGDIVSQRFACRAAGQLQVYGDQYALTEILDGHHARYSAGTPEYARLLGRCKAETTVLFCLADWVEDRSTIPFPDGLGWYRLRFTSRWSLQSLVGKLEEIQALTRGRLRGIPFGLRIAYQEVPGPDGKTRRIPVWRLGFKPPEMIQLNSGSLRGLLSGALEEGRKLQLIEAPRETIEDAEQDRYDVDVDSPDIVEVLTNGSPRCDAQAWERRWFMLVRDTWLATDGARETFLEDFTRGPGQTGSLAVFLQYATDDKAIALYAAAAKAIGADAFTQAELSRWPAVSEPPANATQLGAIKVYAQRIEAAGITLEGRPVPVTESEATIELGVLAARLYGLALPAKRATTLSDAAPEAPSRPAEAESAPEGLESYAEPASVPGGQPESAEARWVTSDRPSSIEEYGSLLKLAEGYGIDIGPWQMETGWTPFRLADEMERLKLAIAGQMHRHGRLV